MGVEGLRGVRGGRGGSGAWGEGELGGSVIVYYLIVVVLIEQFGGICDGKKGGEAKEGEGREK